MNTISDNEARHADFGRLVDQLTILTEGHETCVILAAFADMAAYLIAETPRVEQPGQIVMHCELLKELVKIHGARIANDNEAENHV